MGRFGKKSDPDTGSQEPASLREWSQEGGESRFEQDLGAVESDVEGFGDSGASGFSQAWSEGEVEVEAGELPAGAEDERSQRLRNMDRRFSIPRVAALVAVIALIAWVIIERPGFDSDSEAAPTDFAEGALLIPPGEARDYAEGTPNLQLRGGWALQDTFIAQSREEEPTPASPEEVTLPSGVVAGQLLWGGRAHVAIVGPGVGSEDLCVVASLFASDFEVADVAADGQCENRFDATGDRIVCRGEDIVLLEVWPENPSATEVQPDATRVRVRVERIGSDGTIESTRVSVELDQRLGEGATELAGAPLSIADIAIDGQSGRCELRDRTDVPVQLL